MIFIAGYLAIALTGQVTGWAPLNNLDPMKGAVTPTTTTVVAGSIFDESVTGSDTDTYWRIDPATQKYVEQKFPSTLIVVNQGQINSGTSLTWNKTSNGDNGAVTGTASIQAMTLPDGTDTVTVSDYYSVQDTAGPPLCDGTNQYGIRVTIIRPKAVTPPVGPPSSNG